MKALSRIRPAKISALISDVDGTLVTDDKDFDGARSGCGGRPASKQDSFFHYQQSAAPWVTRVTGVARHHCANWQFQWRRIGEP